MLFISAGYTECTSVIHEYSPNQSTLLQLLPTTYSGNCTINCIWECKHLLTANHIFKIKSPSKEKMHRWKQREVNFLLIETERSEFLDLGESSPCPAIEVRSMTPFGQLATQLGCPCKFALGDCQPGSCLQNQRPQDQCNQ